MQAEKWRVELNRICWTGWKWVWVYIDILWRGDSLNRSHGCGCWLVGCSNTSLLQPIPSSELDSLQRIISAHTVPGPARWLPAGDFWEKILPGVSVSKNFFFFFFFCPVLELFKREAEPLFLHSNFFFLCCWWRRRRRRRRRRKRLLRVSTICYFLSAMPQAENLHPELSIRIKVADIKMINSASQSRAPI